MKRRGERVVILRTVGPQLRTTLARVVMDFCENRDKLSQFLLAIERERRAHEKEAIE